MTLYCLQTDQLMVLEDPADYGMLIT